MIIKIQIIKSSIVDEVKRATYLKGRMDASADEKATKMSLAETVGDDDVHERTLDHDFQTALELVKTIFVDYIVPTAQTIGDNVIYYGDKDDGIVEFTLDVSRRYNGTLTDTLARLVGKYVEDYMIFQWWLKTTNLKQAEPYQVTVSADEVNIRRCFVLSGPKVPTTTYPTELTIKSDGEDDEAGLTMEKGEETTLSYSLNDGAIDDIEAHSEDPGIIEVHRCRTRFAFTLMAKNTGVAVVRLFSKHNDDAVAEVEVTVTEEEGYEE